MFTQDFTIWASSPREVATRDEAEAEPLTVAQVNEAEMRARGTWWELP